MFNVIICGVVKNADKNLQNNLDLAIEIGKKCDKYKIVIYENNSTDRTKSILSSYSTKPQFEIIMEDISPEEIKKNSKIWAYTAVTGSDHSCRMEQISNARNKLITEIQTEKYAEYNYVVMIDLDGKFFAIDGIINSLYLIQENPLRIIYGNSLNYYDYYALRSPHYEYNLFGPELIGEHFWANMYNSRLQIKPNSPDLVTVYSAFNGIGVYDKKAFIGTNYDALVNPIVKDGYKKIIALHPSAYERLNTILKNPCPKFPGGEQDDDFYWKNNSGYNKPVICEHVAFNFALFNELT